MIPISAQTDFLSQALQGIFSQYGATIGLIIFLIVILVLVLRGQLNAKTERDNARTLQLVEDTKRDEILTGYAAQFGAISEQLGNVRVELAEERGARKEISSQLQNERKERQHEREELKDAMRDLADKLKGHEGTIEELKLALAGKQREIGTLIIERDNANDKLAEKDAQLGRIQANLDNTTNEVIRLNGVVNEQKEQIVSLSYELAAISPILNLNETLPLPDMSIPKEEKSEDGTKPLVDISVTIEESPKGE